MKIKYVGIITVALVGLVISGCASEPSGWTTPSAAPTVARPVLSEEFVERIDGSTATVPLMRSTLQLLRGTDSGMHFNKTIEAYDNLIAGNKDIIFATPPSKEERASARKAGVELEVTPLVKDALVFLVNKANPVDGLTRQQAKDIYRGKITNWSQVGGDDQAIIPYQRQVNSGSQTLFLELAMGGTKPMAAPLEYEIGAMEDLVDRMAIYDNAEQALGYSVFYFTQEMYVKDTVKLLAIDGVAPSTETIADGSYAYQSNYHAVMRKSEPADSVARQLVAWCLSDEGQKTFAAASYVPLELRNIVPPVSGYGYQGSTPENTTQSSGTGGPVGWRVPPKDESSPCVTHPQCMSIDETGTISIDILPEYPQLDASVHDWLDEITQGTQQLSPKVGGYASVTRDLFKVYLHDKTYYLAALFRLSDGHRMELSDFFYDGVNYIDFINRTLLNNVANQSRFGDAGERIGPFTGLPSHTLDFSLKGGGNGGLKLEFIFSEGNPFYANPRHPEFTTSVTLNLPFDLSPYGYFWQTRQVLVNGRSTQHIVSNYASVNPHDAQINATIDAWVAEQKGTGTASAVFFYMVAGNGHRGAWSYAPVFSVTWVPSKGEAATAYFSWETCKRIS